MYIVPNDLALAEARENLLAQSPGGAILFPKVYTIFSLEARLAGEIGLFPAPRWPLAFFLNSLAPALGEALEIPGDLDPARAAELAERLGDGIARIRLSGLSWEEVEGLAPARLSASVARLGREYDSFLGDRHDRSSIRRAILERLEKGPAFRFLAGTQTVKLAFFQRLSPFEGELVKALSRRLEVELTLNFPNWVFDEMNRPRAGYLRRRTLADLEGDAGDGLTLLFADIATGENEESVLRREDVPPAGRRAAGYLFGPPPDEAAPPLAGALRIIEAPNAYVETENAGRLIKELILKGVAPGRIAVAAPSLSAYLTLWEDVARRFGIPFRRRRGDPLRESPPILALLDLLSLFGSLWERRRVARVLASPYFDFGLSQAPVEELIEAQISDDRAGGGFAHNLGKSELGASESLKEVWAAVRALKSLEEELAAAADWEAFLAILDRALVNFAWGQEKRPESEERAGRPFPKIRAALEAQKGKDRDAVACFGKVFGELKDALVASPHAPPATVASLKLWLQKALSGAYAREGSPSVHQDAVYVLNYYELHGNFFEALFLLGLNEGGFPAGKPEGAFWPEAFLKGFLKTKLKRSPWTQSLDRYLEEEEMVAAALGQARRVFLSYSDRGPDRRPTLPAPLLDSLRALWPAGELVPEKMGYRVPPPGPLAADGDEARLFLLSLSSGDREWALGQLGVNISGLNPRAESFLEENQGILRKEYLSAFLSSLPTYKNAPLLSIRLLTDYANCPRAFWLEWVLGARPVPEETQEWSYLERGLLAHRVLEEFTRPLVGLQGPKDPGLVSLERLFSLFDRVAAERFAAKPVGRLPLYRHSLARARATLGDWLEAQDGFRDQEIWALEWEFGPPMKGAAAGGVGPAPGAPLKVASAKGPFYLRGRADRLDLQDGQIIVRDYKLTHSERYELTRDDLKEEERLGEDLVKPSHYPLLMYRLAARANLKKETRSFFEFLDPRGNPRLLETAKGDEGHLARLYENLLTGAIDPTPEILEERAPCAYCAFKGICPAGN
jgi:hypothetical protein